MKNINIQLFGPDMPPWYGTEGLLDIANKITKIDEKINELAIEREEYVEDFKKEIKKLNTIKD